jgi:CBS-domain-containing membrane protein
MPCHAAMIDKVPSLAEDTTVEDALKALKKAKIAGLPVVDDKGVFVGVFSYAGLLQNILPLEVGVGSSSSVTVSAAPGIAKRLRNIKSVKAGQVMIRNAAFAYPETPTWDGVSLLLKHGDPLVIVDNTTKKPMGIMTKQTALEEFDRMQD